MNFVVEKLILKRSQENHDKSQSHYSQVVVFSVNEELQPQLTRGNGIYFLQFKPIEDVTKQSNQISIPESHMNLLLVQPREFK